MEDKLSKQKDKARSFATEFKEFISRGNVIDMAVGVVMGTAFTAIVNSLVNDIIMPIVGGIVGGIDLTGLKFVFEPPFEGAPEVALAYGNFIQTVVDFLLIAFVIFLVVKVINNFHKKEEAVPAEAPKPSDEAVLLSEIRDLLKEQKNS